MSRQRRRDTAPEVKVRSVLRRLGHSYRLAVRGLPGTPDIANRRRRWAIFVHGCYWHHHPECRRATLPKANRNWWIDKFQQNTARDAKKIRDLETIGFDVLVVWECETVDERLLESKLTEWFEHFRNPKARIQHGICLEDT
jgi:DNA mismatch endonuclease (patch repair protein)